VVHQGQIARDKIEGEVVKYMYDSIVQPALTREMATKTKINKAMGFVVCWSPSLFFSSFTY